MLTSDKIERGRLVAPFNIEAPLQEAFYLISPETSRDHPDADKFRAWLIETAENDPENKRNRDTYRA